MSKKLQLLAKYILIGRLVLILVTKHEKECICLQNDHLCTLVDLCVIKLNKYLPGENLFFNEDLQVFIVSINNIFVEINQNIELCFYYVRKSFCYTTNLLAFKLFLQNFQYRTIISKKMKKILITIYLQLLNFICTFFKLLSNRW